jgi:hypothetical protein
LPLTPYFKHYRLRLLLQHILLWRAAVEAVVQMVLLWVHRVQVEVRAGLEPAL